MTKRLISLITAIFFIPVQLAAFDFEKPHDQPVQKPEPTACSAGICYSISDERKLLRIYNAYLFFMDAWPELSKKFEALETKVDAQSKQIDSLQSDLSMVKTDRKKYSEKYQKEVQKRMEAQSWSPFGGAAPWYVAAGVTLFSSGVIVGAKFAD